MVFKDYMNSLPNQRQETIQRIADETMSTPNTVYRWLNGSITPPPVKQQIIANILGVSAEELFPKENK